MRGISGSRPLVYLGPVPEWIENKEGMKSYYRAIIAILRAAESAALFLHIGRLSSFLYT